MALLLKAHTPVGERLVFIVSGLFTLTVFPAAGTPPDQTVGSNQLPLVTVLFCEKEKCDIRLKPNT